jgi:hypothetical protein
LRGIAIQCIPYDQELNSCVISGKDLWSKDLWITVINHIPLLASPFRPQQIPRVSGSLEEHR